MTKQQVTRTVATLRNLAVAAGSAAGLIGTMTFSAADGVRTGSNAYGDWRTDAPGVMRKITPADLPPPFSSPPRADISRVVAKPAGAELKTMPRFAVAPFVTGMMGARVLRVAPNGDIFLALSGADTVTPANEAATKSHWGWVGVIRRSVHRIRAFFRTLLHSQPKGASGTIMVIRARTDMSNPKAEIFATDLRQPYGIAFYPPGRRPQWVYVGESGRVVRFPYHDGDVTASGAAETVVSDLPTGGHWTRDIAFSPDGKTLYVAVGSATNVAEEMGPRPIDLAAFEKSHSFGSAWDDEEWRADVLAYDPDGKNKRVFASGLRNCSGLAVQSGTGVVYSATNERDLLGDNLPPDYVTSVSQGAFYGWPWYYIGAHEDARAGGGKRPDLADRVTLPDVLIQPHSAPLGIAFNPGGQFPPDWKGDAFVALHGSWNRALRTGYKVVRLPFKDGKAVGTYQDFVVGFVADDDEVWGRPVGVAFAKDGSLLFSDDGNGVVYRVAYKGR